MMLTREQVEAKKYQASEALSKSVYLGAYHDIGALADTALALYDRVGELEKQIGCLITAVEAHKEFNNIRNDLDAYLFSLCEWAMGESKEKPSRADYGIKALKEW